jgi:hypothetical protein
MESAFTLSNNVWDRRLRAESSQVQFSQFNSTRDADEVAQFGTCQVANTRSIRVTTQR